jgi:hypothetical protein
MSSKENKEQQQGNPQQREQGTTAHNKENKEQQQGNPQQREQGTTARKPQQENKQRERGTSEP